ncbi:hypothetical protein DSO57_1010692 [Entomophthora muscae]|uniref:Uncharacterized protein n=1 Tax=Entomophthora muscae TaxID=34485 RepID=A0ACC2SJK9_9FUNG|nr:hypothetical protein DSO57_1010692 [Entomophthora muscae]
MKDYLDKPHDYHDVHGQNDNLDAPKSQNTEPESNPGQNPLQTTRPIGWEPNNPLLIDKVVASLPGPKPLAILQDSASKLPVPSAKLPSKTPNANPPKTRKSDQEVKPGSVV